MIIRCLAMLAAVGVSVAHAEPALQQQVAPLLNRHCSSCHAGEKPAGGFDWKAITFDLNSAEVRQQWVHLYDRVAQGEMPPASEGRLDETIKSQVLTSLSKGWEFVLRITGFPPA